MQAILQEQSVPQSSLKTQNLTVYPKYEWTENRQVLTGYVAALSLEIQLNSEDFAQLGSRIISLFPQAGNVNISSTQLGFTDFNDGVSEARTKAFEHAQNQAQHLAQLAGKQLGAVLAIEESRNTAYSPVRSFKTTAYESLAPSDTSSPNEDLIAVGEESKVQYLTVTFALK